MERANLIRAGIALGVVLALGAAGTAASSDAGPSTSEPGGGSDPDDGSLADAARKAAGGDGGEPDEDSKSRPAPERRGDRTCKGCGKTDADFENMGKFLAHCRNCPARS